MFVSEVTFRRAQEKFKGKPACLALLNYLHPFVSNFNFETGQKLVVSMPRHRMLIGQIPSIYATTPTYMVPYSRKTIRKVVFALGLCPDELANKEKITIARSSDPLYKYNSIEL